MGLGHFAKKCKWPFREKVQMVIPRKSASCQAVKSKGNLDWVVPRKSANDECPFREKVQGLQAAVDNQ